MKKPILLLLLTLTLFSCSDPGGDPVFDGFQFAIKNETNKKYSIELVIGGMKNDVFIPTDSIIMQPEIEANSYPSYFTEANRWKPNLNKIRAIPSERCYFKIKLSNNRVELIGRYNQQELMGLLLPNEDVFEGDYGRLLIAIWENEVTGYAGEEL